MAEVVSELLREHLSPTVTYVASLIAIQRAYINTNHPDFLGAAGAMASLESEGKKKKRAEKTRVSVGNDDWHADSFAQSMGFCRTSLSIQPCPMPAAAHSYVHNMTVPPCLTAFISPNCTTSSCLQVTITYKRIHSLIISLVAQVRMIDPHLDRKT